MKNMQHIRWILVFAAITALIGACSKVENNQPVRIGIILPMTGSYASFGEAQKKGYELAREAIQSDATNPRRIEIIFEDDASTEEKAVNAAKKLITEDHASALIGSYSSSCTLSVAEISNVNKTPIIIAAGAADEITMKGYDWIFRINAPASVYARTITEFFVSLKNVKTLGILYANSLLGNTSAGVIEKYADEKGLKVVFSERYDPADINFAPVILGQLKKNTPDAIILISYLEDGVEMMKLLKKQDINPRLFFGFGAGFTFEEFIAKTADASEFMFHISQWSPQIEGAESRDFVQKFTGKYGETPTYHSAEAYSALMLTAEAIKRAKNVDKTGIRESLLSLDMQTPYSRVKFENYDGFTNQNRHEMVINQVQGGKFVIVWPPERKNGKAIFPAPPWNKRKVKDRQGHK